MEGGSLGVEVVTQSEPAGEGIVEAATWLGVPIERMANVSQDVIDAILARAMNAVPESEPLRDQLTEHLRGSLSTLRRAAYTDPLTGLPNRRALERRLSVELQRAQLVGRPVALFVADINDFKAVNDQLGHAAGDLVLRTVAQRLREAVRSRGDEVGRWGGDEFVVICPETGDDVVERIASHVADAVSSEPVPLTGQALPITVSIGFATSAIAGPADLIAAADAAMYRSKGRH